MAKRKNNLSNSDGEAGAAASAAPSFETEQTAATRTAASEPITDEADSDEYSSDRLGWFRNRPHTVSNRFALLAAWVAIAAATGAVIGSAITMGLARTPTAVVTKDPGPLVENAVIQLRAELSALKTSIETSQRQSTAHFTKFSERFDRVERSASEPGTKLAALTEAVSRLESRVQATATGGQAHADVTGSVSTAPKDMPKANVLEGWVLRDIYRGRALVENRRGLFEVAPGSNLPGVGRVETVTQQNGRWVVVTPKGLIVAVR